MPDNPGKAAPFAFQEPEWLPAIDSTNDEIRRRLAAGTAPAGTVIAARLQTKGKGRMGRTWLSAADTGLTFSFLWTGTVPLEQAATLPMACGLAVGDFLGGMGVDSRCKWPNDIMVNDAKICGILAESLSAGAGERGLIMGIGLNLADDPVRNRNAGQPVAVLSRLTKRDHDPEALLPLLLHALSKRIALWSEKGFAGIKDDLRSRLWGIGREAGVRTGKDGEEVVRGRIDTIGDRGELMLIGDNGCSFPVVSASALDI